MTKATKNIRGYASTSMNVETAATIVTNTLNVIIKRVPLHAVVISDIKVGFLLPLCYSQGSIELHFCKQCWVCCSIKMISKPWNSNIEKIWRLVSFHITHIENKIFLRKHMLLVVVILFFTQPIYQDWLGEDCYIQLMMADLFLLDKAFCLSQSLQ